MLKHIREREWQYWRRWHAPKRNKPFEAFPGGGCNLGAENKRTICCLSRHFRANLTNHFIIDFGLKAFLIRSWEFSVIEKAGVGSICKCRRTTANKYNLKKKFLVNLFFMVYVITVFIVLQSHNLFLSVCPRIICIPASTGI